MTRDASKPRRDDLAALEADAHAAFPPDAAHYSSERVKYLLSASSMLEQKQAFEAGWVGQRMSWLVISQSFLFNAFAASVAGEHIARVLVLMKWLVPILALVQAIATRVSIQAAKCVEHELYKTRTLLDVGLRTFAPGMKDLPPLGRERFHSARGTTWRGALASDVIPVTLAAAWVIILAFMLWARRG